MANSFVFTFASPDSVAQLVEQQTLNLWVQGSIPCGVTKDRMSRKDGKWEMQIPLAPILTVFPAIFVDASLRTVSSLFLAKFPIHLRPERKQV